MIELKTIAKTIENNLNTLLANDGGQQFKIFADLGEFQNYYKAQNSNDPTYYVNGILEALTPSLLPIRNLQALTQTIRVTFALDVELMNKDTDGNFVEVTEIRKLLMKYIASANGIPFPLSETLTDNTTMTYEVTPSFNGVTVGEIAQLSPIGEILPMYLDLVYTFIQSGINSNSVQIFLNGESLYFEKCSLSRVRLAESNTFAGGKSTKTVIQNNGLSIDINAPLLDTTQSGVIEDDVLDGGNNIAQCVQYVRGTKVRNYIMVFGNTTENLEMAKNIGANVSLVEGKQDILSYNEHWQTYSVTVGAGQTVTIGTAVSEFKGVAFFGDGTSGTSTTGTFEHTYKNAGTYLVRVFNLYNLRVVTFYDDDEVYATEEVAYGELVEEPEENPTKAGYTFDKWYADAELTTVFNFITTHITDNTSIYAGFTLANYTITYNLNGGTNSPNNPSTYTIESATITLENATKTGFTFDGWYEDSEFTTQITQIETGTYGDIDLYAKFTATPYTVTITPGTNTNISVTRTASPNGDAELGTLASGDNIYYQDALTVSYAYTGSASAFKLISETNEIRTVNYSKNVTVQTANATYTCYALELVTLKDTATVLSITHGTAGQTFTDSFTVNGLQVSTNTKDLVITAEVTLTYYTADGIQSGTFNLSQIAEGDGDGGYYINTLNANIGAIDELEIRITATANTLVVTNVTDNTRTYASEIRFTSIKQYQ